MKPQTRNKLAYSAFGTSDFFRVSGDLGLTPCCLSSLQSRANILAILMAFAWSWRVLSIQVGFRRNALLKIKGSSWEDVG
jgi:hypothetical protein